MCKHAQTQYRPSVRPYICLCTCNAYKPALVCMYAIMYGYVCVGVCARACKRAYVCVLSYTNVQVHTRDFSWACKRACACMHVCRYACLHVCTFVQVFGRACARIV